MRSLTFILFAVPVLLLGCTSDQASTTVEAPSTVPVAGTAIPSSGPTPNALAESLRAAALDGTVEPVGQALEAGADVGAADPEGRTALMLAAFNGHTETVRLLLDHGAPVEVRDGAGRTALMFASTGDFSDTVALLLSSGADPDASDESEAWTPLMFAAGEGQMAVVQVLLDHGADPMVVDLDGASAADHARVNRHEEVARALERSRSL